jgi:predicted lactoylglutathione lyase
MESQRVTLITLSVADIAKSRRFYEALGWVEADGGNDKIAFYKLDGQFMALYDRRALVADLGIPIKQRATGAIALSTNYPTEAEVDATYGAAVKAGALPIVTPAKTEWGGYAGSYADPDGHLWELAVNPFWPLDDSGSVIDAS